MDNPLSIKKLTKSDTIPLSEINSLFDEGIQWDAEQGKRFLESPDKIFFLAMWDKQFAGFLSGYRLQRFDKRKAEILIYEVGVNENFQRKGIGKALMEKVKIWGKDVGADTIWVPTNKSNTAAIALYQFAGGVTENSDDTIYVFKLYP